MRFSICVPVYNVEPFLAECLDSIIGQSFGDFELICVNDGSTDNSPKILEEYSNKDKRIKIINKVNQGLLWARRDAIKVATGDYVLFIDSDDKYQHLDVLKILDEKLREFNSPDMLLFDRIDLCPNSNKAFGTHFNDSELFFDERNIKEIRYSFITRNYLNAMFLKCVKRELLKNDQTDYTIHNPQMAEDITQSIFLFDKSKTIAYIPEFFYSYRVNPGSITKAPLSFEKLESKMIRRVFLILYNCIDEWGLEKYKEDVYQKFLNKAYSFYCERIIELFENKQNEDTIQKIVSFDWFDQNNAFLMKSVNLKKAHLKKSYYYLVLGIINKNQSCIAKGIKKYNSEKSFAEFVSSIRNTFRGGKKK